MFELTLSLAFNKQKYISKFYKSMLDEIKKDDGIIIKFNSGGKSYLSIAVSENKSEFLKAKTLDFIAEVIQKEFKYNFFKTSLNVISQEYLTEAFVWAITNFDQDFDREIISQTIEFNGEIVIESLFYFKLQGLQARWTKTVEIINHNLILTNDNSMSDVLRYLCSMSENNSVFLDVSLHDKQIELKNFFYIKKFKTDNSGISKMFAEVIKMNPLKINIKEKEMHANLDEIKKIFLRVFNDKIYFI